MTDTIVNTITLPLSDEDARKLAVPQGTANHTHTFTSVDGKPAHVVEEPKTEPATVEYKTEL